jgi:hypothetical protein
MKHLSILGIFCIALSVNAQELENGGFENWESLPNGNPEPTDWSSTQSAFPETLGNLAPQVLFQDDTNPHSGDYCLHLKNVFVSIANIVSNGIATNGRVYADFNPSLSSTRTDVEDPRWNTPCITRPDSIVGWYRYSPQGEDITTVQALLHTGTIGILPDPNSTGWVGIANFESPNENITEWTRFSAPFVYLNEEIPEYLLINISSGNGTNPVAESEGWYDDIELVYNPLGLDEDVANALLNVYSKDQDIVVDMRKFGAGETFDLEVYTATGMLITRDRVISGYTKEIEVQARGVLICTLKGADGLTLSKKVFVQ